MKRFHQLLLLALIGAVLTSCNMFKKQQPEFQLEDLQGLWQETTHTDLQHYVRFTKEASEETGYLYGREWDEADWNDPDMTAEEFLLWNREDLGHPGNGWFKYKFEKDGNLTEIHLMDNGGAEIPKIYVVTVLTDTELAYYEKDHKSIKFTFEKVVELK